MLVFVIFLVSLFDKVVYLWGEIWVEVFSVSLWYVFMAGLLYDFVEMCGGMIK